MGDAVVNVDRQQEQTHETQRYQTSALATEHRCCVKGKMATARCNAVIDLSYVLALTQSNFCVTHHPEWFC